jgi:hypothetical protein
LSCNPDACIDVTSVAGGRHVGLDCLHSLADVWLDRQRDLCLSLAVLVYAIHLANIVFTLAYLPTVAIYVRILVLTRKDDCVGEMVNVGAVREP